MCWAGGDTNLVLAHSFCPVRAPAQRMDIKVSNVCLELQALRNAGQGRISEQEMNLPRGWTGGRKSIRSSDSSSKSNWNGYQSAEQEILIQNPAPRQGIAPRRDGSYLLWKKGETGARLERSRRREKSLWEICLWEIKVSVEEAVGHGMDFPKSRLLGPAGRGPQAHLFPGTPVLTCSPTGKSGRRFPPAQPPYA